jgi:ribonuclease HII
MRFLIGVDEAGRGPLAGPVAVGMVMVRKGFDVTKAFPGVRDSKQLGEAKREAIFKLVRQHANEGTISYCVRFGGHQMIDKRGMTKVVRAAIARGCRALAPDSGGVHVQLDGLLFAPSEYSQETIIHGDDLVPLISLASIVAKVSRDRLMRRYAREFPEYGFGVHKGYGTKEHYRLLKKHGPSAIHRRSYLPSR